MASAAEHGGGPQPICPVQSLEDIVVPLTLILSLVRELEWLSRTYDVLIPCYGHAGDGNLHATAVKRPESTLADWQTELPLILTGLHTAVAALGGSISGEHGIGAKRARYLPLAMDLALIALQRRLKQAFDLLNILGPGKIVPSTDKVLQSTAHEARAEFAAESRQAVLIENEAWRRS
jgi:glycolate oxidase